MFARIWRGIVRANASDEYLAHLRAHIMPHYRRANGNQATFILCDAQGQFVVFLILSFWDSRAALENFSDPQANAALPSSAFLLAFESTPAVFRVLDQ